MSEKSFAVASVSVAIVWGTFFYPPMPHRAHRTDANLPVASGVSVESLRAAKAPLLPAKAHLTPVALITPQPGSGLSNDCAFSSGRSAAGCAPSHKLASE
jgi:hypothetical protein